MYKLCKTEQSAIRQREMELGLLELMKIRNYAQITVSDLCEFLQIPRKSFYRYFNGKEGAFHALIDHTMLEYERFCAEHGAGKSHTLHTELTYFFLFWKSQKVLLDALERSNMTGSMVERALQYAAAEGVIPLRFLTADKYPIRKEINLFLIGGMSCLLLKWHRGGYQESPEQMAQVAATLISQPLLSNVEEMF